MTSEVERIARGRIAGARPQITNSLEQIAAGNPLGAEPNDARRRGRLERKAGIAPGQAELFAHAIETAAVRPADAAASFPPGAEAIWGDTLDFVNVCFLERGARVARAVGRVAFRDGRPQGSGFLMGGGLFLTNHHVLSSIAQAQPFVIEFDYEVGLDGRPRPVSRFAIDTSVFVTDPVAGLDFTVVAVGAAIGAGEPLDTFGWCGISDAPDKHMLGEFANVVQHPQGRFKEVVLRENRLVSRFDNALHYVADTEPGSSGSPVYNGEWAVIALHHWGGPQIQRVGADGKPLKGDINEGIRISAIVKKLRERLPQLDVSVRTRIETMLAMGAAENAAPERSPKDSGAAPGVRVDPDGRVTWTLPIELSMRIPLLDTRAASPAQTIGAAAPPASTVVTPTAEAAPRADYSDRSGYNPSFIDGHRIDLPKLTGSMPDKAARNRQALDDDDPFELKYHHFSVVMNRERRLAFYTASNINGVQAKSVDRKTKTVKPLRPDDPGLEAMNAAEATENWYDDPRLDASDFAGRGIYDRQVVPGQPVANSAGRIARMFQRGHLVRRLDPVWGPDTLALAAELDTFHWTNCSPQVGFFNQGTAAPATPNSGGGRLWRAVENYVLRNAVADRSRVSCFTGPIFDDVNDRIFRGVRVPMRFFKIAVWSEAGNLRALAMIASQAPVIEVWPEALFAESVVDAAELFAAPDELEKVGDFLSTVAEIEAATGLAFGAAVAAADIRRGEATTLATSDASLQAALRPRRKAKRAAGGKAKAARKTKKRTA